MSLQRTKQIATSTLKKATANRQNAKLSKGPTSERGKRFSRLNSTRHGLTSQLPVLPDEDESTFRAIEKGLQEDLSPGGYLEEIVVARIAGLVWRLRRAVRYETGLLTLESQSSRSEAFLDWNPFSPEASGMNEEETKRFLELSALGRLFKGNSSGENALKRLNRYEVSLERSLFRHLHELQRLQKARNGESVDPPVVVDVDVALDEGSQ